MNRPTLSPGQLAQVACLLEATARKPGNVHRYSDFSDSPYFDYLLSAAAIAGPLDRVVELGVGGAVLQGVEATRRVVATNTNLGMLLVLAPLAAVPEGVELRAGVMKVLDAMTVADATFAYQAIRLARPGGLGKVAAQDVAGVPTVTLRDAMRLAAEHDLIARQYANGYADVFQLGLPALRSALKQGRSLETAIVFAHLTLMTSHTDTLIVRKRGEPEALEALRRACKVITSGWPGSPEGRAQFDEFDAWLRADGHARNPGATADLMSAVLFAAVRDGTIALPITAGPAAWTL
jgi:triphosphoribosyl-dephospho-CoA synthase